MKKSLVISALFAAFTLVLACSKQNAAETYTAQESAIDKYVYGKFDSSAVRHFLGSTRVTVTPGKEGADSLERGDSAYIYWAGYIFNSGPGTLFSTNDPAISTAYQDTTALGIKLGETPLVSGLENGLAGIVEGEKAYIVFSGKYGFGGDAVYSIPPYSALIYQVTISDIIKEKNHLPQ